MNIFWYSLRYTTPGNSTDMNSPLAGNFGPEKKYLAPTLPKFPANTLPAPRPRAPTRPGDPLRLGFSIKSRAPPPPAASDSGCPSPEQKQIQKYPKCPPRRNFSGECFTAVSGQLHGNYLSDGRRARSPRTRPQKRVTTKW